jgi:catechol-2,3-dioxygenase
MAIVLHSKIGLKNLQELKRKRKIKNKGRNSLKRYRKYNHRLIELVKWNRKIQQTEKEMTNLKFVEARL